MTAADLPLFLYEDGNYDLAELDKGLCRGRLLVRASDLYSMLMYNLLIVILQTWRHIFTSPSSAVRDAPGAGRTKSGQAKLNGLEAVTGRTIAYAALQVCFILHRFLIFSVL